MVLQLLLLFIYIIALVMLDRCFSRKSGSGFSITLPQLFFIALIAYTVLPMFDCILNQKDSDYIVPFLGVCIIIAFSLTVGYLIGDKHGARLCLHRPAQSEMYLDYQQQFFWTVFWGGVVIAFLGINILFNRGGLSNAFSTTYRDSYVATSSNTIGFLEYSAMPYAMMFNDKRLIRDKHIRRIAFIISMVVIAVHFLLGNRNLAVMVGIGLVWSLFREKKFKKVTVYLLMIAGIVFLGIVAVMREYSIMLVLKGEAAINWDLARKYAFSFANGELGTTFKFETYKSRIVSGFQFPYRFGYSYIILPLINVIPSALWGGKPTAYADYYSHHAFGGFDGTGYGFSPIYEAQINFGLFWWIVFIIVGYFLARCNRNDNDNMNKFFNVGLVACILLNFFRIDFTTCFKFFAMMWVFKLMYQKSFRLTFKTLGSRYYMEAQK